MNYFISVLDTTRNDTATDSGQGNRIECKHAPRVFHEQWAYGKVIRYMSQISPKLILDFS